MKPKYRAGGVAYYVPNEVMCDRELRPFPGWSRYRRDGSIIESYCWKCNKTHYHIRKKVFVRWTHTRCPSCGSQRCEDWAKFSDCSKTD